jgi:hypothetical protein
MHPLCCRERAELTAQLMFPHGDTELSARVTQRLQSLGDRWGQAIKFMQLEGPMAYAVDDPGRLNGLTRRFKCPHGHPGSVVILNARLIEYTFLVQSVMSKYISSVPQRGTPAPFVEDIYGLSSAFDVFHGLASPDPISDEADGLFVSEGPGAWDLVTWVAQRTGDFAQLFLYLHEISHALPVQRRIEFGAEDQARIPDDRRACWLVELNCDAIAFDLMYASASRSVDKFLPWADPELATGVALQLASLGADLALFGMLVIDRMDGREMPEDAAYADPYFARHPPARRRRNTLSGHAVAFLKDRPDGHSLSGSIYGAVLLRDQLFQALSQSCAPAPDGVRRARWVTE